MRRFISLSVIALLASAGTALAKQPTVECPADVKADVEAAIAQRCPCDAQPGQGDQPGEAWKNHGKYVSCVVRYRNELRKLGCLSDEAKRTIARCAARSTCGKEGAVLCCVYDTSGTCSDLTPGNLIAEGTCSNDALKACDTNTDCIVATGPPRVSRREDRCIERGGTPVGGGSVCSACPLPPPLPPPPAP